MDLLPNLRFFYLITSSVPVFLLLFCNAYHDSPRSVPARATATRWCRGKVVVPAG
jgi:hypothetical protein